MDSKSTAYIIRWLKAEKPEYQFGELLPTERGRLIPTPPVAYYNLNALLLFLKNRYQFSKLVILAMGFDEADREALRRWSSAVSFVGGCKFLEKPAGKKSDGSPVRTFLVDENPGDLKLLKQMILDEHFEMVSMARHADSALRFFRSNFKHIDLVLTEAFHSYGNLFEVIREMKILKNDIRIVVVTAANSRQDIQKLLALRVDGCLLKPLDKPKLMNCLRSVCTW